MMECEDIEDLRAEDAAKRRRLARLLQAPHPQDPDHPVEDDDE